MPTHLSTVRCLGPVTQAKFLSDLGLQTRAEMLMKNATPAQAHYIKSSVQQLTDEAGMGGSHKAFVAITGVDAHIPPGFE